MSAWQSSLPPLPRCRSPETPSPRQLLDGYGSTERQQMSGDGRQLVARLWTQRLHHWASREQPLPWPAVSIDGEPWQWEAHVVGDARHQEH